MAKDAEFHIKLIIGSIATELAIVRAENDELREELAALKAKSPDQKAATV